MLRSLQAIFLALFLLPCCSEPGEQHSELGRIIGEDNLQPITKLNAPHTIVYAIGAMQKGCTVNHLGSGRVLTAGHCVSPGSFQDVPIEATCDSEEFDIYWGYLFGAKPYLKSKCKKILVYEYHAQRDYAILQVEPFPQTSIALSLQSPQKGDKISIFSHPLRSPLLWSNYCPFAGFFLDFPEFIKYSCDTLPGSSGAGVFDQDFKLLAIHSFFDEESQLNGGMPIANIPLDEFLSD